VNDTGAGTRCPLDLVASRIAEAAAVTGRRPVVGIDGPGGSGKSTLAGLLAGLLAGASVVQVDDFYLPSSERSADSAGIAPNFDLERLRSQVLEPANGGRETRYQRYDWDRDTLGEWVTLPATGPVIVEGVYCTRDDLRGYYTYQIFCTAGRDVRLRRGLQRDGEEARHLWVDVWMPAEDRYIAAQRPQHHADLVLDGSARDGAAGTEFVVAGADPTETP
jgi:uridine kinase